MTILLISYAVVSLLLGGIAAAIEIWDRRMLCKRVDGHTFYSSKFEPLWFGLFVMMLWPILLIGGLL